MTYQGREGDNLMTEITLAQAITIVIASWLVIATVAATLICANSSKFTKERKEKGLEDKYYER